MSCIVAIVVAIGTVNAVDGAETGKNQRGRCGCRIRSGLRSQGNDAPLKATEPNRDAALAGLAD